MFEEYSICPYPGLRTFNEEESIYFKGRDGHTLDVIDLLQKNKFLMVTGSSGDGKSSLIFGGLIPNARAGFFKSRYNSWKVAHFKPERSPLKNLAESISSEFEMENSVTLETEFNRGFSSLADLYMTSKFYSEDSTERNGSNLLIVADQFEEFFTNPENFVDGAPTQNAQVTVNLLLETARIALSKNLPIYVVFTMRSDYIGQCSSFRGLPEFIGFSQFFVPRLKRKDLVQVIEEPAQLSGNRITRRLSERIIYDLEDGIDQLPMLQHVLSQIWRAADEGKEEMDLIHYAMVGGLPRNDLPDDDIEKFDRWFKNLEPWKQKLYSETGLTKVLNIHADHLYINIYGDFINKHPNIELDEKEVSRAVALVFICLTKIDDSRAVRNRMTLNEICRIINNPQINLNVLSEIIEPFRASGNTFITPFIEEENPETLKLEGDTVLDITHEALIRNWGRLDKWAWKEFEYFEILQDLKKQVNHWIENKKSSKFLLPIGPLLYFEEWIKMAKPNKYWISRYQDEDIDKEKNIQKSESQLNEINEFLTKSSRKLVLTKFVSNVGMGRIAVALSFITILIFSSILYVQASLKENDKIIEDVLQVGSELVNNDEIWGYHTLTYLYLSHMLDSNRSMESLRAIENIEYRYGMTAWSYTMFNYVAPYYRKYYKIKLLNEALSLSQKIVEDKVLSEPVLNIFCTISYGLIVDDFYNPGTISDEIREKYVATFLDYTISIIDSKSVVFNTGLFNKSIDLLLVLGLRPEQIDLLLKKLSVFENGGKENFNHFFPKEKSLTIGYNTSINFKAGFQILGSLFMVRRKC